MPGEAALPRLRPMLATLVTTVPAGAGWAFELKWDGYRILAYADRGRLALMTRGGQDYAPRVRELAGLGAALKDRRAILDGELVALVEGGRVSFQALQNRIGPRLSGPPGEVAERVQLAYLIFDVLHLDGRSLLRAPYRERRDVLDALELQGPSWWVPPSRDGGGDQVLSRSRELGLEGVLAKRADSPYRPGARGREWLKVKNVLRQEFVVAGWTPSETSPGTMRSLLLAVYDVAEAEARRRGGAQRLVYAGRVGTGFSQRERDALLARLRPLAVERPSLDVGEVPGGVHFVRPELVGEVAFHEWSASGELRHASWHGLRPDKSPRDVVREWPAGAYR